MTNLQRNHGLRMAFAVAFGLTFEILRGAVLPPLGPVIALQLLALPGPPPGKKLIITLMGIIGLSSLLAYAVAALTVNDNLMYAVGVGLLYLWGFWLAVRPRTAMAGSLFLTMSIVVTALAAASTTVAILLVFQLLISVAFGLLLIFLAHCLFPHRAPPAARTNTNPVRDPRVPPDVRALLATLIILPIHLWLTADGIAAMVILITAATMLRQPGLTQSATYGITYAAGNLLGGLLAALSVLLVNTQDNIAVLITILTAGALVMAYQLQRSQTLAQILLPASPPTHSCSAWFFLRCRSPTTSPTSPASPKSSPPPSTHSAPPASPHRFVGGCCDDGRRLRDLKGRSKSIMHVRYEEWPR